MSLKEGVPSPAPTKVKAPIQKLKHESALECPAFRKWQLGSLMCPIPDSLAAERPYLG